MFDRVLNTPLGGGGRCSKNSAGVADFKAQKEHYTIEINRQYADMLDVPDLSIGWVVVRLKENIHWEYISIKIFHIRSLH